MGRDTTASKRMAAKRSREKAAGLRRLNIALSPDVFVRLGELMKQHNCTSQAVLIELLVMAKANDLQPAIIDECRNEVTVEGVAAIDREPSEQLQIEKKSSAPAKAVKREKVIKNEQHEESTTQLSLF